MISHSRPLMNVDQVPAKEDDGKNTVLCNQPNSTVPSSNSLMPNFFLPPEGCQNMHNNHAFTSASSGSCDQYQDTSMERLFREVITDKWHDTGVFKFPVETQLECVPHHFKSAEEYVRIFECLLFEECRALLKKTWEELTEMGSGDAHTMVSVKTVERRESGWYDVIVLPQLECQWAFEEGEVAVLSTPRPGAAVESNKTDASSGTNEEDSEPKISGWIAGTVRQYTPVDTHAPHGAVLHFYVGDSYDSKRLDNDYVLKKLQSKSIWYMTVLGSLATTQRECTALHAFQRFNSQMQSAILKPTPEHFKYEVQPPAIPECSFAPNFSNHLHRTFNSSQLAAIRQAAAGTRSFTLVQCPPGAGKTHAVWGMLNVIHLLQQQQYYAALLKNPAPKNYEQTGESSSKSICSESREDVSQNMEQGSFHSLQKLCPKARILVCALSDTATDKLLARVLGRGFIDQDMKVYSPVVSRVGVESQTQAAQAVSIERRANHLLLMNRDEVYDSLNILKARESQYLQEISVLQRKLNGAAAAVRPLGSVGIDSDVPLARVLNQDLLLKKLAAAMEGRDNVLVEMSRLLILECRFNTGSGFNLEDARASLEASFINEAEIVFTTLSNCGRKIFSHLNRGFDVVVIDEAARASELAVLPALSLCSGRCILVGDSQQLPATDISKDVGTLSQSTILFQRFQHAGCPIILLSEQYRLHSQIRDLQLKDLDQRCLTDIVNEKIADGMRDLPLKDLDQRCLTDVVNEKIVNAKIADGMRDLPLKDLDQRCQTDIVNEKLADEIHLSEPSTMCANVQSSASEVQVFPPSYTIIVRHESSLPDAEVLPLFSSHKTARRPNCFPLEALPSRAKSLPTSDLPPNNILFPDDEVTSKNPLCFLLSCLWSILPAILLVIYIILGSLVIAHHSSAFSGTEFLCDAIFFSTVTVSSTGYGDSFPLTCGARTLTSIYLLIGRILMGFFAMKLSDWLQFVEERTFGCFLLSIPRDRSGHHFFIRFLRDEDDENMVSRGIMLHVVSTVIYSITLICIGVVISMHKTNLAAGDAVYFAIISVTTTGFGDETLKHGRCVASLWLLISTCIMDRLFALLVQVWLERKASKEANLALRTPLTLKELREADVPINSKYDILAYMLKKMKRIGERELRMINHQFLRLQTLQVNNIRQGSNQASNARYSLHFFLHCHIC